MTNDNTIHQVLDFRLTGPGDRVSKDELSENPVPSVPGATEQPIQETPINLFEGPRNWVIKWFGPFFSVTKLPPNRNMGLYLIYVGNYPIYVSSSANLEIAITRHLAFAPRTIIPIDFLGRELLQYTKIYHAPVNIKTGLIFENNKLIHPKLNIHAYRRAAAALAFCHVLPCNRYARLKYEFEELSVTNAGKYFPLKAAFHAKPADPDKAAMLTRELANPQHVAEVEHDESEN